MQGIVSESIGSLTQEERQAINDVLVKDFVLLASDGLGMQRDFNVYLQLRREKWYWTGVALPGCKLFTTSDNGQPTTHYMLVVINTVDNGLGEQFEWTFRRVEVPVTTGFAADASRQMVEVANYLWDKLTK